MMKLRRQLAEKAQQKDPEFRWRGGDVSRLEGFSDTVFGFALTLLVVSLEVPRDFQALLEAMRGFASFAFCFFILFRIWESHYSFFRRYGLQDQLTVYLNGLLLFVVLLYVYPLKFVFTIFVNNVLGLGPRNITSFKIDIQDGPALFIIYGLGFTAVYVLFALFYANALRQKRLLELNAWEQTFTQLEIQHNCLLASVGVLSVCIARFLPLSLIGFAGYSYALIGVVETWCGWRIGSAKARHRS